MATIKYIIFLAVLALTLAQPVNALGIGPSKMLIDFKPNTSAQYDFVVVNGPGQEQPIELYVTGDKEAANYISFPENNITLKPSEYKQMHFVASFPNEMTPGRHNLRIGAVESSGAGGQVGGRVGVEMLIAVEVPTPGKYLVIEGFELFDVKVGEPITPQIIVANRGKETISLITAAIDVLNSNGKKTATAITTESSLKSAESRLLTTQIKTTGFLPGKYSANVAIDYDGLSKTAKKDFRVGDLVINILKVYGDNIKKDAIGKISVDYESQWNEPIDHVLPLITLSKNGIVAAQTAGQEFRVEPFATGSTNIFIDSRGLEAGEYAITTTLHYENKTATGTGKIQIVNFDLTWAIILMLIAIVLIFVYKNWKKKNG